MKKIDESKFFGKKGAIQIVVFHFYHAVFAH